MVENPKGMEMSNEKKNKLNILFDNLYKKREKL